MKDLKDEYSKMIEADVPDLWDRIESALPKKDDGRRKGTGIRKIWFRAGIAAACVCAAIVIPLATLQGRAAKSGSFSSAEAKAEATPFMEEKAAAAGPAAGAEFGTEASADALEYDMEEAAPAEAAPAQEAMSMKTTEGIPEPEPAPAAEEMLEAETAPAAGAMPEANPAPMAEEREDEYAAEAVEEAAPAAGEAAEEPASDSDSGAFYPASSEQMNGNAFRDSEIARAEAAVEKIRSAFEQIFRGFKRAE